jgi:hypothetical protein
LQEENYHVLNQSNEDFEAINYRKEDPGPEHLESKMTTFMPSEDLDEFGPPVSKQLFYY